MPALFFPPCFDPAALATREQAIDAARQDLLIDLADHDADYGRIYACQNWPRCHLYGGGGACPWCTVILVHRDGREHVIEPACA